MAAPALPQELREIRGQIGEIRGQIGEMREQIWETKNLVVTNHISRPDQPLMPLRSITSNEPIPFFPNTANDLQRLPDATTIDLLRALGGPTDGNASTRKLHLRLQYGLKEEPV
ncbi:MAG: hypothetical protein Q9164_003657 [Protoblastenia rupestris]